MMGKKAWSGNGDKNRTGREEREEVESRQREPGGNGGRSCSAVAWKLGSSLERNRCRLSFNPWGIHQGDRVVYLGVSVSAQGEIEEVETENTGVDLHAKRVWGFTSTPF